MAVVASIRIPVGGGHGMKGLLIAGSLLLGGGCAPSNLADVIRAAGQDNATFCGRLTTVYGTATFMRSNIYQGDVSCDTLSIRATTNVTLPMTITPSFSVAPAPQPLPVAPPLTVPRAPARPPTP